MKIPNWVGALIRHNEAVKTPPGFHHVDVLHDDWCDQLSGKGPCNCEPDIRSGPLIDKKWSK